MLSDIFNGRSCGQALLTDKQIVGRRVEVLEGAVQLERLAALLAEHGATAVWSWAHKLTCKMGNLRSTKIEGINDVTSSPESWQLEADCPTAMKVGREVTLSQVLSAGAGV